jgi:hypothetical protein
MDDRAGRGEAREARARYMVGTGGFWYPAGLVWLPCHRSRLEKLFGVLYLLGRYDDPGSGFWALWACFPLGLGLGLPWFVLGWLHAVCSGQWMQCDPEFGRGQGNGTIWQLSDSLACCGTATTGTKLRFKLVVRHRKLGREVEDPDEVALAGGLRPVKQCHRRNPAGISPEIW